MIPEVSLTIIAACAVVLIIFSIVVAIYLIQLLIVLKKSIKLVEQKVEPVIDGAAKIVNIAKNATECIHSHMESPTSWVHAIGKIRNLVKKIPIHSTKRWHDTSPRANREDVDEQLNVFGLNVFDCAEWLATGIVLFKKLRNK